MSTPILKDFVDISGLRGAAPDASCFYSTSSSIAQKDWLPALRSKFNLHLNTKKAIVNSSSIPCSKLPNLVKYRESGFTKNTLAFVPYDRDVDEKEIKYSESAFATLHADNFKSPKRMSPDVFDNVSVVAQEILDSGFTKIPRKLPHKQDLPVVSEMVDHYVNYLPNLNSAQFEKSFIYPSLSGFANDVSHIKSFGNSVESPFEKVDLYPRYEVHSDRLHDYPVLMKADGYTRSHGHLVLPKTRPASSVKIETIRPQDQVNSTYIIGNKQETGAFKNNHPYQELKEPNPYLRFTSETAQKYNKSNEIPINLNCSKVNRSGFTLCNKFQLPIKVKDEVAAIKQLHPLVAAYRMEKIKHAYAPKPTGVRS